MGSRWATGLCLSVCPNMVVFVSGGNPVCDYGERESAQPRKLMTKLMTKKKKIASQSLDCK